MNGTRKLRLPLLVIGIYSLIVGLALMFPAAGEVVFGRPVADAAVMSGWGTSVIALGLVALAIAANTKRFGPVAWALMAGLLLTAVDLAFYWSVGEYTARTVLVPLILNVGLSGWLWTALPKRREVINPDTAGTPGAV